MSGFRMIGTVGLAIAIAQPFDIQPLKSLEF